MFNPAAPQSQPTSILDSLDKAAIIYLVLPLVIFLALWFEWWAALALVICTGLALRPLLAKTRRISVGFPLCPVQVGAAVMIGAGWTVMGGTDHLVFANADWHIRDAVLHDLVASQWPVGYGLLNGSETVLRTSLAYYLPPALVGKMLGLSAAHAAMLAWTAIGTILFLLQVFSMFPARLGAVVLVSAAVVLFSGLDIVGCLLNRGPRFWHHWNVTTHLEWWADTYQFSSMTTQLFWVPNHALGGWLMIGLLYRAGAAAHFQMLLPILVVAAALWSPLTVVGLLPFVICMMAARMFRQGSIRLRRPDIWGPALLVAAAVGGYLALDPTHIRKGVALGGEPLGDTVIDVIRQLQFFLLEAGFIGFATLMLRPSSELILALLILAVLPFAYLGPGNDLVMRASIPSLAVLMIGACRALLDKTAATRATLKKAALGGLLAVGAATPLAEFARAAILPAWPVNLDASLVGADCGRYPPHYIARVGDGPLEQAMRRPKRIPLGPLGPQSCDDPGFDLMWRYSPL